FADMATKINAVISGATPPGSDPDPEPKTKPGKIDLVMFRQQIIADTWASNDLDYALMDNSDLFKSWLQRFDRATGKKNSDEWYAAIEIRDKEGCSRVINTFLLSPEGAQYKELLKPPEPFTKVPNPQPDIPAGGGNPTDPVKPDGKIWNSKLVNEFYVDQSRGKYKGKDEEVKVIEADIFAAQNDGRWQG
ncbi:MAG: hypothetical protein DRH26_03635, partial [Deltaproteobacteria bacterium]